LQKKKLVIQEKVGLNFDGTLLLHFDGTKIVNGIDWEKELAEIEKGDKLMMDGWVQFVEDVKKQGKARECWITDEIIDELKSIKREQEKFIANGFDLSLAEIEERGEKDAWNFPLTPRELKDLFINHIASSDPHAEVEMLTEMDKEMGREFSAHPLPPSKEEAEDILNKLLEEGVAEIVPFYFFKINKEKASKKFWEAKAGYRSPVHLFVAEAFGAPPPKNEAGKS